MKKSIYQIKTVLILFPTMKPVGGAADEQPTEDSGEGQGAT